MPTNFYLFFVVALIPLLIGFIYYSDALFGKAWKSVNGFTDAELSSRNMAVVLGLSYLFSVFLAFVMSSIAIHQSSVASMMMPELLESGSEAQTQFNDLMAQYGNRYLDFKHGAIHGAAFALFTTMPIIGINALFERRAWKYIWIHTGYWLISFVLMGGILCEFLEYAPLK